MKANAWYLLSLCCLFPGFSQAQNLDFYGVKGQPLTLLQNPGAETDLRFHISFPGITTQGNMTAPLKALWGDVGQQFRTLEAPNVGLSSATDVEGLGLGWKHEKTYTWIQTGMDVDARFHLDKDLMLFALYGMEDANGQIDPAYEGDFKNSDLGLSAMGRIALGHQRRLNEKWTLGASIQMNRLLGGFQWHVNQWSLSSTFDPASQTNSLSWNSDMQLSAFGLIADGARLDSAMDFPRYLLMGMVPAYWDMLKSQKNSFSLNAGFTYNPTKSVKIMGSITGLPLGAGSRQGGVLHARSLQWSSSYTYSGYSWGFSPSDSLSWSRYLANLQSQNVDGFSIASAAPVAFLPPLVAQAAVYWKWNPQHQMGLHVTHVDRLAGQHQSLGLEYHGFYGRNVQWATSYRYHVWDGIRGSSEWSTLLQHRILPWTTLYWGTNLWLTTPGFQNGTLLLPGNFQSWQVTAGLNVTLFEKRYQEERVAKKAAKQQTKMDKKAAKRAEGTL